MTPSLNQEVIDALRASGAGEVEAIDPTTNKVYVVTDCETHRQAMAALRRQQDHDAIAEGLSQIETGEHQSVDEAFAQVKKELGFRGVQ